MLVETFERIYFAKNNKQMDPLSNQIVITKVNFEQVRRTDSSEKTVMFGTAENKRGSIWLSKVQSDLMELNNKNSNTINNNNTVGSQQVLCLVPTPGVNVCMFVVQLYLQRACESTGFHSKHVRAHLIPLLYLLSLSFHLSMWALALLEENPAATSAPC